MTTLDDLDLFDAPIGPTPAPRKCRRHRWHVASGLDLCAQCDIYDHAALHCRSCGRKQDPVLGRRGRTNRSRGNAIEREVGKRLGLRRVGQYGGPDDLSGDLFSVQVKSGGSFPERLWSWLKAVPAKAGQTPLLVVTDAPGPGHRRRALVVLELDEWIALHGATGKEA